MVESMCGCSCSTCEFVEKCGCKGCFESKGTPFHGKCAFALCCMERGYTHCGECEQFPCQKLHDFAFDPEYGDEKGSRLELLRSWAKCGTANNHERDVQKEEIKMIDSRCGLHCTGCEYKETCGCGGCIEANGNPFHGECPVAVCCQGKGFVHCGECPEIPCELLTQYSCDPEHGDTPHGARIEQCKKWFAEGKAKHE